MIGALIDIQQAIAPSLPSPSGTAGGLTTWAVIADVLKALLWPTVAVFALVKFGPALTKLIQSLGRRITKVSLFHVELQLAEVRGLEPTSVTMREVRELQVFPPGPSGLSYLKQLIQDTTPCDYLLIDLGMGQNWLTSRLFLFSAILQRLRNLHYIVFVTTDFEPRRLLGVAPAAVVIERLSEYEQNYQGALDQALGELVFGIKSPQHDGSKSAFVPDPNANRSVGVKLNPISLDRASSNVLIGLFFVNPSIRVAGAKPVENRTWIPVQGGTQHERADWIDLSLYERLFGEIVDSSFVTDDDFLGDKLVAKLVACRGTVVPIVDNRNRFKRLVDRN